MPCGKMIFHYPGPLPERPDTGEKLRPPAMRSAFAANGWDVSEISGDRAERWRRWHALAPRLREFAFVYSENSHLPLRLTEPDHLPRWPSPDFALFRFARRAGVPVGVFVRDCYWRYADFRREVGWAKYLAALPFYQEEMRLYAREAARLFVPSPEFASALPAFARAKTCPLPPGGLPLQPSLAASGPVGSPLRVAYCGGVLPPRYGLADLFRELADFTPTELRLDLIARPEDWKKVASLYTLPAGCTVHQASGEPARQLLAAGDIGILWYDDHPYRRLALPIKLFEALALELPQIAKSGTAAGDFLAQTGAGWALEPAPGRLAAFLRRLRAEPELLTQARRQVQAVRGEHTWAARARTAAAQLTGIAP